MRQMEGRGRPSIPAACGCKSHPVPQVPQYSPAGSGELGMHVSVARVLRAQRLLLVPRLIPHRSRFYPALFLKASMMTEYHILEVYTGYGSYCALLLMAQLSVSMRACCGSVSQSDHWSTPGFFPQWGLPHFIARRIPQIYFDLSSVISTALYCTVPYKMHNRCYRYLRPLIEMDGVIPQPDIYRTSGLYAKYLYC